MKVNVFAAQVHVEDLVLAHIEQNLINGNVQCKTGVRWRWRSTTFWRWLPLLCGSLGAAFCDMQYASPQAGILKR